MTGEIQDIIAQYRQQYGADIVSRTQRVLGQPGQRISHLSVGQALITAWIDLTGEPFRPHHATTLMAMRRKEHVALVGANPRRNSSLILLAIHTILEQPHHPVLLVVTDEAAALDVFRQVTALLERLPNHDIAPVIISDATGAPDGASFVIASYDALHRRLLRLYDRGWRSFWESVGLVALIDVHELAGIGMAHVAAFLVRMQRVLSRYHNIANLQLMVTALATDGIDAVLRHLQVGNWRHISADDYGYEAVDVEIWHLPEDYVSAARDVARAVCAAGHTVHVRMNPILQTLWEGDLAMRGTTTSERLKHADVLIMVGVGDDRNVLLAAYTMGYRQIVVLLGAHPLDSWFSQYPDALLTIPKPAWPLAVANAYVLSQHVRAAAYELPLHPEEVASWGTGELCERLQERKQLTALPKQQGWIASSQPDPYEDFHVASAIGLPVLLNVGDVTCDAPFDATGFERWLGDTAVVPPWFGGLRVTQRDEAAGSVVLHVVATNRRTLPLRECSMHIRETKTTQTIARGRTVTYGRVLVDERVIGIHQWHDGALTDVLYASALTSRWSAPAWWIDVPQCSGEAAQLIGWSVALSLPLLSVLATAAVVPCADSAQQRIYFVDAQPGGNGAAEWMFAHLDQVFAQSLALAELLVADPLLTEGCQHDEAWLRSLVTTRLPQTTRIETVSAQPTTSLPVPAVTDRIETPPRPVVPPPERVPEEVRPQPLTEIRDPSDSIVIPNSNPVSGSDVTAPNRFGSRSAPRRRWSQRAPSPEPQPSAGAVPTATPQPAHESTRSTLPAPALTQSESGRTPVPPPTTPEEPNINRIMANLRKQIADHLPGNSAPKSNGRTSTTATQTDVHRFAPGQRIFCLPYGDGDVIESFFVNGREYIRAEFPTYGELQIDPAVSLVRVLARPDSSDDNDR